jgi:hypothetical protein
LVQAVTLLTCVQGAFVRTRPSVGTPTALAFFVVFL